MSIIKNYTVLIIEDEFIASEYLLRILNSFGIRNIYKAISADEALKISKKHFIDIAFMDINIKGSIDGIKCANLLNKEYFLPIIFTTAYGDTNTINEAKKENIFGYLIKPFRENDVEAFLNVASINIERFKELKKKYKFSSKKNESINLGNEYAYNYESKTLTKLNTPIKLTKKELEVLNILCENINKNISYEYLKEMIWNEKQISDTTLRDLISRLKKKMPDIVIENISNHGYILKNNLKV